MEVENGPLEGHFPLQTVVLHFHVSFWECNFPSANTAVPSFNHFIQGLHLSTLQSQVSCLFGAKRKPLGTIDLPYCIWATPKYLFKSLTVF